MIKVLVTGANGQLGQCLQLYVAENNFEGYQFFFLDKSQLDITDQAAVHSFFSSHSIDFCVNCAAFTAVDLAETESEIAFKINAEAVKYLAEACEKSGATLVQISTDYVFDGNHDLPYKPTDLTNPINVYGKSKREGEINAMKFNPQTIIIRTSWVYSQFGKNFYTTMTHLMQERTELNVVSDQIGKPTNANDLAKYIVGLILNKDSNYGIRNFSGKEVMSWFDFAQKIAQENHFKVQINPIPTDQYPTPARRPKWSVLE